MSLDRETLQDECRQILSKFYPQNQHGDDRAGGWKAISLIAPDGDPNQDRNLTDRPHLKTPALKMPPYLEIIIDKLECETKRVQMKALKWRILFQREEACLEGVLVQREDACDFSGS